MTDADFDREVIWATSTTGEDFQCVHVDFARMQQAEIAAMRHFILNKNLIEVWEACREEELRAVS